MAAPTIMPSASMPKNSPYVCPIINLIPPSDVHSEREPDDETHQRDHPALGPELRVHQLGPLIFLAPANRSTTPIATSASTTHVQVMPSSPSTSASERVEAQRERDDDTRDDA